MDINKIKEFSPAMGSDNENEMLRSELEGKTEDIANEQFEGYERRAQEQNEKNCDLYQKREIAEVKKIIGREIGDDLDEDDFEILEKNEEGKIDILDKDSKIDSHNIIEEMPKKEVIPKTKKSLWGTIATPFNYGASIVYYASQKVLHPLKKDTLILQKSLVPEAYALVLKILPVQESKGWESLLKAMPEKQLKEFVGLLAELPKIYTNKLKELMGLETDKNVKTPHEVEDEFSKINTAVKMSKGVNQEDFKNFIEFTSGLLVPIRNKNLQVISDFTLGGMYFIGKGRTMPRVLQGIENFKNEHKDTSDVSLKYLSENGFREIFPHIYSSIGWEMELGEDKGRCRQFQKGYCKVMIALPGVDLKEIRIPLDLRFLKMDKIDQEEEIFSILSEIIGSTEEDIQKYLSAKTLKGALENNYLALIIKNKIDHLIDEKMKGYLNGSLTVLEKEILAINKEIFNEDNLKLKEILQKGEWPLKWGEDGLKILWKYGKLVENDALFKFLKNCPEEERSKLLNFNPGDLEKIHKILEMEPNQSIEKELEVHHHKALLKILKENYPNLSREGLVLLFEECKNLLADSKDHKMFACMKFLDGCVELKKEIKPGAMIKLSNDIILKKEIQGLVQYIESRNNPKLVEILRKGEWPGKWGEEAQEALKKYPKLIENRWVYAYLKNCSENVREGVLKLELEDFEKIKEFLVEWPKKPTDKNLLKEYQEYRKNMTIFDIVLDTLKEAYSTLSAKGLVELFRECQLLLDHPEDEEAVVYIEVLDECVELKKEENLEAVRNLLNELDEETDLFLEKCSGSEGDYQEIIDMFKFIHPYGTDMLQKSFSSLGRDFLHFDGVVSHFEVFPKQMIKQLSSDKTFHEEYVSFNNSLYGIRLENIKNYLLGVDDLQGIQDIRNSSDESFKKLNQLVDKSSCSKQEKITVKKYLKYMKDLAVNSWEESKLTQITVIEDLLKQITEILPIKLLTKDLKMDIAQWFSDPTACRLMHEVVQYSKIVKEENLAALERGEKISMGSNHNQRLHGLAIDLIRNLKEYIGLINKQDLVDVVKEILRTSIDPQSSGDNLEVRDVLADIEELGDLLEIWEKESGDVAKIDNMKLLSEIGGGGNIFISELHEKSRDLIEEYKKKLIEMHLTYLPKNISKEEKINVNNVEAKNLDVAKTLQELEDAVYRLKDVIEHLISKNKLKSKVNLQGFSDAMSAIKDSEKFKGIIKEKAIALFPENLSEKEKKNFLSKLKEKFMYLNPFVEGKPVSQEKMMKFLDFMDGLKIRRQDEILNMYHPSKLLEGHNVLGECMSFNTSIPGITILSLSLIPMFETISPINSQITFNTSALSSYHPSYLVVENLGKGGGGDIRAIAWNVSKENVDLVEDSSIQLFKNNYIVRHQEPLLFERATWHMEEGTICPMENKVIKNESVEKKSRVLKSGYGEISISIPTLGYLRSCRFPIDLSAFHLENPEDVTKVLVMINEAGQKREALMIAIEELKKIEGNRFDGIIKQPELFIETAIKYVRKMEKAVAKTMVSANNPNVHFSDVEELNAYIPQQMLEKIFFKGEGHQELWNDYLQAVVKLRDDQMNFYLEEEEIISDIDEIEKLDEVKNYLLNEIEEVFTNKEDLEVIKGYIEKIGALAVNPWDKNDHALKVIEKNIFIVAGLQKDLGLLDLRKMLFPFLIDESCLKVFSDWVRALQVARKANASIDKPSGEEFHNQRLEKKKGVMIEMLRNRPEMTQQQKEEIVKWVNGFK